MWVFGSAILMLAFNNCGDGFVASSGISQSGSSTVLPSSDTRCEDDLLKVYSNTYHPFLNQTCGACHISGPGVGTFASPEVVKSYSSFDNIGVTKINSQAINSSHKPPYTGTQNTARIDELKGIWADAQAGYVTCLAQKNGGSAAGSVVKSNPLQVPTNLGTSFMRIEWDLETQSSNAVPLVLGIDIRKAVIDGITRGYEFRNPTLRLKRAEVGAYQARALNFYLNSVLQTGMTTFSNIDVSVSATTNVSLASTTTIAVTAATPAATDTIALEFSSLIVKTAAP